uniref:Cystinosin n=1 Tax=Rhodosorus marinus TaxID=101924 RepID=A0A7S3A1P0_9RHOD
MAVESPTAAAVVENDNVADGSSQGTVEVAESADKTPVPTPNAQSVEELEAHGKLTGFALACGWIYFFAWSLSFYPQCILNYRKKSVRGLSLDYVLLNVTGFFCYSLFTTLLHWSGRVRASYIARYGIPPQVEFNDIIFAVHGLCLCVITFVQCLIYDAGNQKARPTVILLNLIIWMGLVLLTILTIVGFDSTFLISFLGIGKVTCSFVKYLPQIVLNFRRKSTFGWSISFVLLDLLGGIFSIIQQTLRSIQISSIKPFTANVAKTGLAVETLIFDTIFIVQHCILYRNADEFDSLDQDDEQREWMEWNEDEFEMSEEEDT